MEGVRHPSTTAPPLRAARWTGRVLSTLVVLFLSFSASFKLFATDAGLQAMDDLELPRELMLGIGIVELGCVLLYALPRSAFLGAVLLTGYLGGAVLTHLRLFDPWLTHALFPTFVGAFAWAGLALRDLRVRALFLAGV